MDVGYKIKHIPHPRAKANPLSALTFWWILGTFRKGFRKDLEIEDLYDALEEHQSDYLGDKLEKLWNHELLQTNTKNKKPSLLKALVKCFGSISTGYGLLLVVNDLCFQMTQPMLLGGLIRYFSVDSDISRDTAFLYAAGLVICSIINVFVKQPYMMAALHIGMKIRIAVCSLLYRKALRLSKTALRKTTVGQAVNLLSNDVNRFDRSVLFLVYLWFGPLQTIIIAYYMWRQIGFAAVIGVAYLLFSIPLQALLGKMLSTMRLRTAKRTDERIRFMNEIIVGIQVIKMYAWEKPFAHLVNLARKREIAAVRVMLYLQGIILSSERFSTNIAVFISLVVYVLTGHQITAEKMFVVTAYFNILKVTMSNFFPQAIAQVAESCVSVKRVETFLLYDEIPTEARYSIKYENSTVTAGDKDMNLRIADKMVTTNNSVLCLNTYATEESTNMDDSTKKMSIKISNVMAKWNEDFLENTLTNVSVDVKPGKLVAVIGPVGSGKTSLLHAILKELPISDGSISVEGSISYASQEPWLFTGSVQQNILFGQPMERNRYRKVVRSCALERDFQLLSHGDKTIVGERGVTLSGGQRARINLARAVYKKADVYLLDDPLSAVDTHVGRQLFDNCISGFLNGKTRVLVTHQLQYLHTADSIVILKDGAVEAMGTFTELQETEFDFAKQLHADAEEEGSTTTKEHEKCNDNDAKQTVHRTSSQMSHQSSVTGTEPEKVAEMRTTGSVRSGIYRTYCSAGGNCCFTILIFSLCILTQIAVSGGDYWMSYWTKVEQLQMNMNPVAKDDLVNMTEPTTNIDDTTFHSNGTTTQNWKWLPDTETCIYVYTGLVISVITFTVGSSLCFFTMCMRASVRLHNAMFSSITRATMWFFNSYPSGQILNRFSKDMGSIDEMLPLTMIDCVQRGLALIGVTIIVAVVNVWLLIPTALIFILFYLLRVYYIATSRSVKRLEAITRSPVFSHLNASLQGLTTIRAFGAQALLEKEFDNHQDLHSTSWYLFVSSNRAFGLWLDCICLVYIALITFSFLIFDGVQFGGDVGLGITQAIGLIGMLQWGIRQSAEMENQMTSVERVLEYTEVEKEPPLTSPADITPPEDWPSKGEIIFDKVSFAYSKDGQPILKDICFTINPSEKVGIVGRTGAGKTSLIAAVFHLTELSHGSIHIDGVDTKPIGLHDLRSKISIIPQEPVLFSGPLRDNLDPFNEYPDAVLWTALEEVEMKQAVNELPAGLSHRVSEGGSNFSVGQRQLLCLARAIIRNNKILVLDEATANVDPQTDELIQRTIRRKFDNCTVLTIAHRLHTVMDSDRIIVMDAGRVMEMDHPYLLLQNRNGYLFQMVQQTGHAMAETLFKMAQNSYERIYGQEILGPG